MNWWKRAPVLRTVCEECQAGRHEECDGLSYDSRTDDWEPCQCPDGWHDELSRDLEDA